MRLVDLEPMWYGEQGPPERTGVGIIFNCPCGCGELFGLNLRNPLDGGPPTGPEHPSWQRTGDDFASLTLTPSVHRVGACGAHFFVTNGEIKVC